MNGKTKIVIAAALAVVLAAALVAGGWFAYTAYAQTPQPNQNGFNGGCHNAQPVLELLKTSASDLQAQRQAGKSLLEIATAKGVSEQALTDALLQPIASMHAWMVKSQIPEAGRRGIYPQSNADQMTQYMRDLTATDIRATSFGTMTDFRLFGGAGAGMMGGWNGQPNGTNGMMNGRGGMMGGWTQ